MKKLVVLILAAVAFVACSNKSQVTDAVKVQPLDTAALVQRVNDIYTGVFGRYEQARTMFKPLRRGNFDAELCSADWNEWLKRVMDYDKVNSEGMVGFFESDYWIMGQDWEDLSVSDVQVTEMTVKTATVALKLHNCGSITDVRLEMVREGGEWKIDNFIDVTRDMDWKAGMKEYLSGK
jgi:hypothetical protein